MTVLENLLVPPKDQIGESAKKAPIHRTWFTQERSLGYESAKVLNLMNLRNHGTYPSTNLSGGQTKLLELGRALMSNPDLMLLDEPTAGVAPILARTIFERIIELQKNFGISILVIEHRLDMLFDYVSDIHVMNQGKIIFHGTPQEVMKNQEVIDAYLGG